MKPVEVTELLKNISLLIYLQTSYITIQVIIWVLMYIHVSELHYFAGLQIWCNLPTSNVDQDDPVVEFAACRDILIEMPKLVKMYIKQIIIQVWWNNGFDWQLFQLYGIAVWTASSRWTSPSTGQTGGYLPEPNMTPYNC